MYVIKDKIHIIKANNIKKARNLIKKPQNKI